MSTFATAMNQQSDFPSAGRAVLLAGLAGFFFANFAAQLFGTHHAATGGMRLSTTCASWVAFAYTFASVLGVVAAEPLVRAFGVRRYFVGSAALFAAFGWLQATMPSIPALLAMRTFEGFTTGGFGPRALLAVFMLYRAGRLPFAFSLSAFLLLMALVTFGISESILGWRGMFLVQFTLSSLLVLAGLRWLPRVSERLAPQPVAGRVDVQPHGTAHLASSIRSRRRGHRRASSVHTLAALQRSPSLRRQRMGTGSHFPWSPP